VINTDVDLGLIKIVEKETVPRLESYVPQQPGKQQLDNDFLLHRFTLVFQRESYSLDLFLRMKEKRQLSCKTPTSS